MQITEKLLHFIWQFGYYNKAGLQTISKESVQIIYSGVLNTNQGPDFLNAKIKIGNTILAGNIEIHILASDWEKHQHQTDPNYQNIILHVVWKNDKAFNNYVPVLELQPLVSIILLEQYNLLMQASGNIPCNKYLPVLNELGWVAWKERLVAERLLRKTNHVLTELDASKQHWEEVCWWLVAENFGMKQNAGLFIQMAKTISVNLLAKHKNNIAQLEALLLGQANFLNQEFSDSYPKMLQKEYRFLQKKYQLAKVHTQPVFLRMRPAGFPTLRLAQLAALVHQSSHLFSKIKEINSITEWKELFRIKPNDYWLYHYTLEDEASFKEKSFGEPTVNSILINTIAPLLFAYGEYNKKDLYKERAIQLLQNMSAEQNVITLFWKDKLITQKNAFDTQALIELKNNYCSEKKCLECAVGNKILGNSIR